MWVGNESAFVLLIPRRGWVPQPVGRWNQGRTAKTGGDQANGIKLSRSVGEVGIRSKNTTITPDESGNYNHWMRDSDKGYGIRSMLLLLVPVHTQNAGEGFKGLGAQSLAMQLFQTLQILDTF